MRRESLGKSSEGNSLFVIYVEAVEPGERHDRSISKGALPDMGTFEFP